MTDVEKVLLACRMTKAKGDDAVIGDAVARAIAMDWHGGQRSALYSFGSSGAIDDKDRLLGEIDGELQPRLAGDGPDECVLALEALKKYVESQSERGPVEGWSKLWVR